MNNIINKFLLAQDKLMSKMYNLYIVLADHLQKNKEIIQKFKETGNRRYIYQKKTGQGLLFST